MTNSHDTGDLTQYRATQGGKMVQVQTPANADRTAIIDAMCTVQDRAREQIAFYEQLIVNIEESIERVRAHG